MSEDGDTKIEYIEMPTVAASVDAEPRDEQVVQTKDAETIAVDGEMQEEGGAIMNMPDARCQMPDFFRC